MFGLPLEIDPTIGIVFCLIGYACVANLVRLVIRGDKKRRKDDEM